jgi:hypothetical protein
MKRLLIRNLDRPDNFEEDYPQIKHAEETAKKMFMWASWLSFMPDHAPDSILDAWDLPVDSAVWIATAESTLGGAASSLSTTLSNCTAAKCTNIFSLRSLRPSRFKLYKPNQRHLFIEPDLIEPVTTFFTGYSELPRYLSASYELTPRLFS